MLLSRTVCASCVILLCLAPLFGQSDLATVTGVVTDSAGAVMPGVVVTIRNVETNIARNMVTNTDGYFTVTNLPPGSYELLAERQGFRSHHETGITLEVGQELRSDIKMSVGSINESVNVTAEAAMLNTENGTIVGQVVGFAEIQDMPMNGRDFTELALLVPGVVTNAQGGAGGFGSINGARADNLNFRVDGIDDRDARGGGAQFRPNVDALQEFKMEVSGYSAEYGKAAGGILNMVLRSGTNQYHGSAFEYFRNDVFDAKAYFSTDKLGFHQNQFGGTITGPLSIPKLYNGRDHTFFMVSWESLRNPWGQNELGVVPSLLEREGNFSKSVNSNGLPITLRNPFANNAVLPGNLIPASLFDPIGQKLLSYYPLPNREGVNNYLSTAFHQNTFDSFVTRADHRFSNEDNLSFRYGKRFVRNNSPFAGSNLGIFQSFDRQDTSLLGVTYTHMFTPTLLMEASGGFSRVADFEHMGGPSITAAQLGMQGSTTDPALAGFPLINVTGYLSLGYANNQPVQFFVTDLQAADKFTWIKASHTVKWGFGIGRERFNQPYFNNSRGTMTINGVWTGNGTATNGNAIADLELGLVANSSLTSQTTRNYLRLTNYDWFMNDDWKVSHSLTLNLGLRYEIDKPPVDRYDRAANFIPGLDRVIVAGSQNIPNFTQLVTQTGLQNQVGTAAQFGLPESLQYTNYHGLAPRVGFAWRPFGDRTVLRGGYGIFHAAYELNDLRNGLDNTFPIVLAQNFAHTANKPSSLPLAYPWLPAAGTLAGTTTASGIMLHPPYSYLQSYNLTVERELGHRTVLQVGFVGSKGTHLARQYNLNQPYRTIDFYEKFGTSFPVLYPPLGTITYYDMNSNSIYNAGQIVLRRQASGGFFYRFSYSYSKSIDDSSQLAGASTGGYGQALDPRNLGLERARSDWDRGHVFQATFSWLLPVGKNKRFLSGSGKAADAVLGGWTLAGTAVLETGPPFTVEDSSINANIGESNRPNRIAKGNHPVGSGRRGVDYPWFVPGAFVPTASCASRTNCSPDQYGFIPFVPGNSGRGILDGPGEQNINLSLLKRWTVGERKFVQFRWEVFNIFNHPNFLLPNRFYNETAAGYLDSVQASGQGGPRIMQFALRYEF